MSLPLYSTRPTRSANESVNTEPTGRDRAVGHVSGAHVNPAVTLGMAATRKFPWRFVSHYVVAQLVGAVLAACSHSKHPMNLAGTAYS